MRHILYSLMLLAVCGCRTMLSEPDDIVNWIHAQIAPECHYPLTATRTLYLADHLKHPVTLTASDANHLSIDFGNNLILKLKDPQYQGEWAHIRLLDLDGDRIKDLEFITQFNDSQAPMTALFLYRPTEWERYLLPEIMTPTQHLKE